MKQVLTNFIVILLFAVFLFGCNKSTDPVSPVSDSKGTINGKVMNNGVAIKAATVITSPFTSSVTTDTNGNYTINNLSAGTYFVIALKDSVGTGVTSANVTSGGTVTENIAFKNSTGVIYGKVTSNGTPLVNATVSTIPETITANTDNNGNYVIPDLTPGAYTVISVKTGVGTGLVLANVTNGGAIPANIQIVQTGASTVTIGSQIWTARNLNVDTYRNGDTIPQVQDPVQWANLTTGAWCYYNNNPVIGNIYGKLYNWYAVNDPRGLAQTGWHIPTDIEWTQMTNFLGGDSLAGGKLKDTILWDEPNIGATNSSGFSVYPSGNLSILGYFEDIGKYGVFWTASESNNNVAWFRFLIYNSPSTYRYVNDKNFGFSVRCIRD
ncbi:MAG: FISUMP domain-containing protein [Ignavibacteria bacterium]